MSFSAAANMHSNRLYLNKGNFQFEDITEKAGVGIRQRKWSTGVTMADINGDGWLDIYVCNIRRFKRRVTGSNALYINNGPFCIRHRYIYRESAAAVRIG